LQAFSPGALELRDVHFLALLLSFSQLYLALLSFNQLLWGRLSCATYTPRKMLSLYLPALLSFTYLIYLNMLSLYLPAVLSFTPFALPSFL
jgi:hypothetical protein